MYDGRPVWKWLENGHPSFHPRHVIKPAADSHNLELSAIQQLGWTMDTWMNMERGERAMWVAFIYGNSVANSMRQYDEIEDNKREAEAKSKRGRK